MAKATTASKQVEQQALLGGASSTELATVDPAATSALVTHDELDGLDDYGDDGLSQVDGDDLKLSLKIWNMKGIDPVTKRQIPADVFFDTVTETTSEHLDVVLLDLRKSREWREFLEAEKKSVIHCRSADRITGTMEDGTQRYCEGCPEAQWATTDEGKRKQQASDARASPARSHRYHRLPPVLAAILPGCPCQRSPCARTRHARRTGFRRKPSVWAGARVHLRGVAIARSPR